MENKEFAEMTQKEKEQKFTSLFEAMDRMNSVLELALDATEIRIKAVKQDFDKVRGTVDSLRRVSATDEILEAFEIYTDADAGTMSDVEYAAKEMADKAKELCRGYKSYAEEFLDAARNFPEQPEEDTDE